MQTQPLPAGPAQVLSGLALEANQTLEKSGQESAAQAFNLGCSISLLPAAAAIVIVFILARANWVIALVTGFLAVMIALLLASLAAATAKKRGIERHYELHVGPEIERAVKSLDLSRLDFDLLAAEVLPPGAPLLSFLSLPQPVEEQDGSRPDG